MSIRQILGGIVVGRVILIAFAFMGWAFYQLSGGADFDPAEVRNARIDHPEKVETVVLAQSAPNTEEVTRVSLDLASLEDVLTPAQRGIVGQRTAARQVSQEITDVQAVAETTLILPSLIENAVPAEATVTPVDFSGTAQTSVAAAGNVRRVTGNRVNVRGGPGTSFNVVNRLVRGDSVEILEDPGNGWVMLRPIEGGPVGWMADFLLSEG